jgi:carbonic anhydrase/acetyltransferase-like protein (isoleucine patch superfamily)
MTKLLRMPIYAIDGIRPELPPEGSYWIAPDAVLIGRVRLAPGASVWWGAVLRGDNDWITIGANSNVQDLTVMHTDAGEPVVIGDHVTIGHRVIIHSAQIGDGALIGMGSTILNLARIGRGCLVGANALVTEGKVFEAGKLVLGSPARAVRDLSTAQSQDMEQSALRYVANARRYAAGLQRIDRPG